MKKIGFRKTIASIIMAFTVVCSSCIPTFATSNNADVVVTTSYNPFANTNNNNSRSIIGTDNRNLINNTDDYPYSAISYLEILYQCGCSTEGTGFMISENCMLTAGHCLICPTHEEDAHSVTAYFGFSSWNNILLTVTATSSNSVIYHDPNFTGSEKNYDYGYVVFNTNIGNTTGWFGLAAINDSSLDELPIHVTGYIDTAMYDCAGKITSVATNRIKYDADTEPGESGAPVYLNEATHGHVVVAIHTNGTDLFNWKNSGWRITSTFIDKLADLGYVTKVS